jgi:hypothetical protein
MALRPRTMATRHGHYVYVGYQNMDKSFNKSQPSCLGSRERDTATRQEMRLIWVDKAYPRH